MKKAFFKEIEAAKSVTIFAHSKTDGDAVGSSLALFSYVKSLGKDVSVAIDSEFPTNLMFLKEINEINKNVPKSGDLAIIVDSPTLDRLGRNKFKPKKYGKIIAIDHHVIVEKVGHINYVKPQASSTCEVIYDLFVDEGEPISPEMAKFLLVGILTDTAGLRFSSTSPDTFRIVASLLETANLKINDLINPLFSSLTHEMFLLKKLAYDKIEFYNDNKIAFLAISNENLLSTGVSFNDTKIVIEIGMGLKDVKLMALVTEGEPGVVYVSFRSKGEFDVNEIAGEFGGGGHKEASGCKIFDTFNNAKHKVLDVLLKYGQAK